MKRLLIIAMGIAVFSMFTSQGVSAQTSSGKTSETGSGVEAVRPEKASGDSGAQPGEPKSTAEEKAARKPEKKPETGVSSGAGGLRKEPRAGKKTDTEEIKITWVNEEQKARCEAYSTDLKDKFLKARYFSIQGDPCSTAEHSEAFLADVEKCKADCPEGYLKKLGYNDRIIRNLKWLQKLGREKCLR